MRNEEHLSLEMAETTGAEAASAETETKNVVTSTPKESDVYDRQIRLWGKDAQEKMSQTKVLYIHVTGVSSEILKNLVLAGIHATIYDSRPYPDTVVETPSFLLALNDHDNDNDNDNEQAKKKVKYCTVAEAIQPMVEELNPLLGKCPIADKATHGEDISKLSKDFLEEFTIVIASHIGRKDAVRISNIVTSAGNKFFLVDSFGMDGACVMDLNSSHTYRPEMGKKLLPETSLSSYSSLEQIFEFPLQYAVNRFHKKHPPLAWMKYRSILHYHESTNGTWPSIEKKDDFQQVIRNWIKETDERVAADNNDDKNTKQKHVSLAELMNKDNDSLSLKQLASVATCEIAPVCAVLGGIIGNEVIKAISGKGEPANNTILFDGQTCKVWTFLVTKN